MHPDHQQVLSRFLATIFYVLVGLLALCTYLVAPPPWSSFLAVFFVTMIGFEVHLYLRARREETS